MDKYERAYHDERELVSRWKETANVWKQRARRREKQLVYVGVAAVVMLSVILNAMVTRWLSAPQPVPAQKQGDVRYARSYHVSAQRYTPPHILACVRMTNGGTRCSGVVISRGVRYAAILSAAHCVVGNIGGKCKWTNPDGTEFEGELLAYDRKLDVSLFRAPADKVLGHSFLPRRYPTGTVSWEACGYTSGDDIKHKVVEPRTDGRYGRGTWYYVKSGPFAGGDSGGAIFGDSGLVGIISGSEYRFDRRGREITRFNKQIVPGCSHAKLVTWVESQAPKLAQCGPNGCPPGPYYQRNQNPNWNPGPNVPIRIKDWDDKSWSDKEMTQVLKYLLETAKKEPEKIEPLRGPPGKDGKDGADGKPGKDGADGKPGKDGVHVVKTIIENGSLIVELSDGKKIVAGPVTGQPGPPGEVDYSKVEEIAAKKIADAKIDELVSKRLKTLLERSELTVIFEGGDDADEPSRTVRVPLLDGTLKIPPVVFRVRNVDVSGKQVGTPLMDSAPLGLPLKYRFRPPLQAKQ